MVVLSMAEGEGASIADEEVVSTTTTTIAMTTTVPMIIMDPMTTAMITGTVTTIGTTIITITVTGTTTADTMEDHLHLHLHLDSGITGVHRVASSHLTRLLHHPQDKVTTTYSTPRHHPSLPHNNGINDLARAIPLLPPLLGAIEVVTTKAITGDVKKSCFEGQLWLYSVANALMRYDILFRIFD